MVKENRLHAAETGYVARSSYGVWEIYLSEDKIARIVLPPSPPRPRRMFKWLGVSKRNGSARANGNVPPALHRLMIQIGQYFSGGRKHLTIPFVFTEGSRFRRKVWGCMRLIPFGKTAAYGDLANSIGSPHACRAVGSACAANPLPLLIPCHRIVGKRGLGGFSAGLGWKRFLLSLEKIPKRQ